MSWAPLSGVRSLPVGIEPPVPSRSRGLFAARDRGINRALELEMMRSRWARGQFRSISATRNVTEHSHPRGIRGEGPQDRHHHSPDGRETGRGGRRGGSASGMRLADADARRPLRGSEELSGSRMEPGTAPETPGAGWSGNGGPHHLSAGHPTPCWRSYPQAKRQGRR